jgi:uncharacterized membrane protein
MAKLWSRETRFVFAAGVVLAVILAGLVLLETGREPTRAAAMAGVVGAALLGGRIPAIVAALEAGFSGMTATALIILINTAWLFLTFPICMALHLKASNSAWLHSLYARARERVDVMSAVGAWGLAFFVWLPFPLTGALIGAVIGLLMSMSVPRLMFVVVSSMWLGVVMWTFGFDVFMEAFGTLGKVVCYVIAIGCIVYSIMGNGGKRRAPNEGSP